jgi:predicted nuclease of restriction endonuclease-like (RecB) superfamily
MDTLIKTDKAYRAFILDIKQRIQAAQIKASVAVNHGLIGLYWDIGASIVEKQKQTAWGEGFLQQMSVDLQHDFPDIQGFSYRNLRYIKQWHLYWSTETIWQQAVAKLEAPPETIGQQVVAQLGQIPWGHNLVIISKIKDQPEALFYVQKTIENNWSRAVLTHQIEGNLFRREGKAITNFKAMLPKPLSDLAEQTLKDPYKFDFLMLREKHDERELETALVDQVARFLMELGAGFSFLGHQYKLTGGDEDFYPDMLFYHTRLHCYVVVELKAVKFKPEYAGKLNFYISAVDGILRTEGDNPTIGMLICKSKNKTIVEYALKDINKPIGVSEYEISSVLPDEYKSSLPSIEEIEAELKGVGNYGK